MKQLSAFPADFLWGASTASHQVEGGNHNQWSEWEKRNAEDLARTAKDRIGRVRVWDMIQAQATDPANYISDRGVNHYTRYKEDFDILQNLGLNAFRFSIEWSRVQPTKDSWDEQAIRHYHEYIDELNRRGIEPVLTLWHWTMPTWFTDMGAFARAGNMAHWETYVSRMAEEFGHKVRYVLTLNEPNVYCAFSYHLGEWPPEQKNLRVFLKVYWNLTRAHRTAYRILKNANPSLAVGIAAQLSHDVPKHPHNLFDRLMAAVAAYGSNWWFLNRIRRYQDFVGLNYYFTNYWRGRKTMNPDGPLNDLGWYMEPSGVAPVLVEVARRYHKPILITENGLADASDSYRQWWLEETMRALEEALAGGADLIGYLHWSLVDNFEWKFGWWPKFGLVAIDRKQDMKRTVRPSARWWSEYIKMNMHYKTSAIKSK